jgi:hypothetical protein
MEWVAFTSVLGAQIRRYECSRCETIASDPARDKFEQYLAGGMSAREAAEKLVRQRVPGAKALARVFAEPFGKVRR